MAWTSITDIARECVRTLEDRQDWTIKWFCSRGDGSVFTGVGGGIEFTHEGEELIRRAIAEAVEAQKQGGLGQ